MKYRNIILVFLAIAFTIPASIKTEYKNYAGDRVDLSLRMKPYSDSAVLITWKPEGQRDVLGYEIERHDETGQFVTVGFVPALRGSKARKFQFIDYPATSGKQVYRLKKIKTDGSAVHSREDEFQFRTESGIRELQAVQKRGTLELQFQNEAPQEVSLVVFNASGQKVASILPQWFDNGPQKIVWNIAKESRKIANGTYIAELHGKAGIYKTEVKLE